MVSGVAGGNGRRDRIVMLPTKWFGLPAISPPGGSRQACNRAKVRERNSAQ
jgi:hypothetical protein